MTVYSLSKKNVNAHKGVCRMRRTLFLGLLFRHKTLHNSLLNKQDNGQKTKQNMMMYKRTIQTALIFLLTIGFSFAVKNDLEDKLAEDERFKGRELQAANSLKTEEKTEGTEMGVVTWNRRIKAYTQGGAHSQ